MISFKLNCNTARRLNVRQIFSVLNVGGVLLFVKQTKNNTPSIKITTEVGTLSSMKRNKQFLCNFQGWNLEIFNQLEGWSMSQVAFRKNNRKLTTDVQEIYFDLYRDRYLRRKILLDLHWKTNYFAWRNKPTRVTF